MEKDKKRTPEWRKEARVGLVISLSAVLLFGGMFAISSANRKPNTSTTGPSTPTTSNPGTSGGGEVVEPIHDPLTEVMNKPFLKEVTIARYFYDMQDELEIRSKAIVEVPGKSNTYAKSLGVDYVLSDPFNVVAACSGKVIAKSNDSIYGNMLLIEHASGIQTLYCSLGEMKVNKGQEVSQGDVIGVSGESTYTSGLGSALHFEIVKEKDQRLNPEKVYTQLIKSL